MNNYKIKVNDEAESKEAQELFEQLGFTWAGDHPENGDWYSHLYAEKSSCCHLPIYVWNGLGDKFQELTLPQLRDLVAQSKSKSIEFLEPQNDGTYKLINWTCMSHPPKNFIEVPDGAELYVYWPVNNDHNFQSGGSFYEDGIWNPCSFSVEEIKTGDAGAKILWSRETIQEKGLISGADAKLAWAKGENVQARPKTLSETWEDLSGKHSLDIFEQVISYEFRLKPRTITLNIEIPAPFEPKDKEGAWCLDGNTLDGYKKIIFDDFINPGIGFWRTEEEIKQVVAALRGGIKG